MKNILAFLGGLWLFVISCVLITSYVNSSRPVQFVELAQHVSPTKTTQIALPKQPQDVSLEIASVTIRETNFSATPQKWIVIGLNITNRNKNKRLKYKGWAGWNKGGSLKDNFGDEYLKFSNVWMDIWGTQEGFGAMAQSEITLYPQKSVKDAVVFEAPVDSAQYIDLELPGENVGTHSVYRFRIPISGAAN